jgi:hypothetical protein
MSIAGFTINKIRNHLDQVSAYPILFDFNGLNFIFSRHFFSIRGRYLETKVYVGDSSSDRVHNLMYAGKVNLSWVYKALYATVIRVAHVQVQKQVFKED